MQNKLKLYLKGTKLKVLDHLVWMLGLYAQKDR